jgi:hypothetical protein
LFRLPPMKPVPTNLGYARPSTGPLTPAFSPSDGERVSEGRVRATLKVYDILGREIATLVNQEKPIGEYEVEFDGSALPSGIYFYQLKAGNFVETKKMILLR